jgi:uncharacterized protein YndB with AHSA1/START domain
MRDDMPSASNTVTIRRTPAEVFAFIADGTNARRWRSGVLDIALESGDGLRARYRQGVKGPGGRRIAADYEITTHEPNRRLVFMATAGPVRPRGEFILVPDGDATVLTFALEAELPFLKRLVMGRAVQTTIDAEVASLEKLRGILEA